MKKIILITFIVVLSLTMFSAKFLYFSNVDEQKADFINVERFDKISYDGENVILTVYSGSSSLGNQVKIPFTNDLEQKKLSKVQALVSNGYIVSAKPDNKYFGDSTARNLTVSKIKEVKFDAFTNDFYKFLDSNETFFNVNRWLIIWIDAIPVSAD
jgi:archaellum component FlaF (FlaF/FlaG flagellin family)